MNYSSYVYYVINDEDMKPNRKEKDPEIKSTTLEAIGMLVFLPLFWLLLLVLGGKDVFK
jgi:hypothetical protein